MAVRNDITVRWDLSPRLIIIDASSSEITMQDLIDTLRTLEALPSGIDEPYLMNSSGKENLGGGTTVGLTVELQNAQIYFSERSWTKAYGTIDASDATGTYLYDSGADFINAGITRGYVAFNIVGAMATILTVDSSNILYTLPLSGGPRQDWQVGDTYAIYPNELCATAGGNLVAVDASGNELYPILQSPNVQSTLTSSSSATNVELDAIQYSSYQNSVWLDPSSSNSGTDYPMGTREYPVNNLQDAVNIGNNKGFSTLQILRSMVIDSGTVLSEFTLIGKSHVNTNITIDSNAVCDNITISNARVTGTLDGGTHIESCTCGDLNYVNGHIHNSGLHGRITLGGNEDAVIANCSAVDVNSPPIIDMNLSGQDLVVTDWSGPIHIDNLESSINMVDIQIDGGVVNLDPSIFAGQFIISGIGILVNNASDYTSLNIDGLISKTAISTAVWDELLTTENHNIEFSAGNLLRASSSLVIRNGVATGNGNGYNQIQLDSSAQSYDGAYDPAMISIISGSGDGQTRLILQYEGSIRLATVDRNWKIQPDTTSEYIIIGHPGRESVNEGIFQDASLNSVTLNPLAESTDNVYNKQMIFIRGGIGADQVRTITSYDGSTKVATVDTPWEIVPNATSSYEMLPARIDSVNDVWDYDLSGFTDSSTAGYTLWNLPKKVFNKIFPFFFAK